MNLINGIFKRLYWPICRAYARHLGDRPADSLLRFLCSIDYYRLNRFWPNFVHPQYFSEKLWNRMLYDRNPQLTLLNDNLRVREHVKSKVGSDYLIPLLWSGNSPKEIPFDELPLQFVLKANHGCGYNIIVRDKSQIDRLKNKRQLQKWLDENFGQDKYLGIAWGYKNIRRSILIEEFINENGKAPLDFKCWVFSGHLEFFSVHFDRFERHSVSTFDRNFRPIDVGLPLTEKRREYYGPENYKEMINVAETLAEEFDFMRVDLYNLGGRIYFGEYTPYPGGVTIRFLPKEMDYLLGERWK